MQITIQAHAKVNLGLIVLGQRKDGFHKIITIMQLLNLADKLIIENTKNFFSFYCNNKKLLKNNLAEKAARIYFYAIGEKPHVQLKLIKQIPIAAGLGGGSSDAAATLFGLNILHKFALDSKKMFILARTIGADVPFFLKRGTAFATGIGDCLRILPNFPLFNYVLINPGFAISTAWIYNQLNLAWTKKSKGIKIKKIINPIQINKNILVNDLENVSFRLFPQLADIKQALKKVGAIFTQMTGSGPTIYGIFDQKKTAINAAKWLKLQYHDWWIKVCNGIKYD